MKTEEILLKYAAAMDEFENYYDHLHKAHKANAAWKRILNSIEPRSDIDYKKYSSRARADAKRRHGTIKKKTIEHRVPCKIGWLLGIPIEELNKKENITWLTASKNRRKSFEVDFELLKELYPDYVK